MQSARLSALKEIVAEKVGIGRYWPFCFRAIASRTRSAFGSPSEAGVELLELPKENLPAGVEFPGFLFADLLGDRLADFEPCTPFRFASANGAVC